MIPLINYFRKIYGVTAIQVNINPITATVATTATKVLSADANRLYAAIANLGTNFGFIAPGPSVSSSYGFRLNANTGFFEATLKDNALLTTQEWWAISDTAQGTWFITEVLAIQTEEAPPCR